MPAEALSEVSLFPPEVLSFRLERATAPKTILRITNHTDSYLVFKIKTTQPSWYLVRPNQNIIAPRLFEDINISLVETECK